MKLIVGLGNPGKEYEKSRHNIGFSVLEALASDLGVTFSLHKKFAAEVAEINSQLWLVKPQNFMNDSGRSVRSILDFYKQPLESLSSLYVIHDDLDLELGSFKLQFGTGPKVHNGLLSLYRELGTEQFWHLRIGVDGRAGDRSMPGRNYVLQPFSATEQPLLEQVSDQLVAKLKLEIL